jgi:hypothetical protein
MQPVYNAGWAAHALRSDQKNPSKVQNTERNISEESIAILNVIPGSAEQHDDPNYEDRDGN